MTDVTPSLTTELDARAQGNARAVKTPSGRMGLYDPRNEHDACGVGFIAQMKNVKSHQIVVDATDTAGQQSSAVVTVNVQNGSSQRLHVERVDAVLIKKGGSRAQGRCDVFIYDASGIPVPGASVAGHWTGLATDTFAVATGSDGKAVDYSNSASAPSGSSFTCAVDSVSKSGWARGTDTQTSSTVTVP